MGNTHIRGATSSARPQSYAGPGDPFGKHSTYEGAPGFVPGSPLTYSIQSPMEPPTNQGVPGPSAAQAMGRRSDYSYTDIPTTWPNQPPLFPTVIIWSHGGMHVEVEGSFDNWTTRQALQRSGKDFTIVKLLPPGVYQYKFIVDGEWKYAPELPAMFDDMGNVNNVLEVHEYVPDEYAAIQGFDPPPSPPESYNCALPTLEDYAKPPPAMPQQLNLTLLNVNAPVNDDNKSLPRPQHVILDHLYVHSANQSVNAVVMGATWRYRSKYVTSVMYKPVKRP
mmetsp:Transcript_29439/g.83011  ORF Transcript_29439/g.83011 Transcript_29439/m.83011 type:complete len:279 (-) Transcript_29439:195-1031(-)